MAYTELVSFIQEQLNLGRDVRTIREYLLRRNIDPKAIDEAFDEVFGSVNVNKNTSSSHSHSAGKFVLVGLVLLVIVFIGIGVNMYYKIPTEIVNNPVIEKPDPNIPINNSEEFVEKFVSVCPYEDTEEKYECYLEKFDKNEVQCHEINDYDEREFCYVAQDLYVLSA